jgi:hypothetical protein
VGTISDGLIQLVKGPVGDNFYGASMGAIVLQHRSSWVCLGKRTGVHETTSRNMGVRLTLCFCENGKYFF